MVLLKKKISVRFKIMYEIIYILRVKFKQHLDVDKSIAEFVRSVS